MHMGLGNIFWVLGTWGRFWKVDLEVNYVLLVVMGEDMDGVCVFTYSENIIILILIIS